MISLHEQGIALDRMSNICKEDHFPRVNGESLGTYSIGKLPATYARQNECCGDDIDGRSRWKRQKRIVDHYICVILPSQDVLVASVLCVGGPIKYKVKDNARIITR